MLVTAVSRPSSAPASRRVHAASILAHTLLFAAALLTAFALGYNFTPLREWFVPQYVVLLPVALLVKHTVFTLLQQHHTCWRYTSDKEFAATALAVTLSSVALYVVLGACRMAVGDRGPAAVWAFPSNILLIDWAMSNLLMLWSRFLFRHALERGRLTNIAAARTLIVGAGDAAETLLREIQRLPQTKHDIVGLLDDDDRKIGRWIHGVCVLGPIEMIGTICTTQHIAEVLIAIPSAPRQRIREIVNLCAGACVRFRIVPGLSELIEGSLTIESQLRPIRVEDLLTRDPVELDEVAIGEYVRGKRVLVTGAGGSIGSEMCRQIARFEPAELIIAELSENNLFDIQRELEAQYFEIRLQAFLADICDEKRMNAIFRQTQPDIVYHAAAHKHVPMIEAHHGEGIKNNVLGTLTLANLAHNHHVSRFVYISTDKAVNPTSIMGCTKRIAEMYVQGLGLESHTRFVTVRFGNVLGSRGSVVPIFQEQIASGGPVTITHPDITRYFMTIPEAAQLVLQAGAIGHGGEIFLLEMGEPVKIVDLARNLITLSGLTPDVDIALAFTGLRPGEKLHEELRNAGEGLAPTTHPNISVWTSKPQDWEPLVDAIPKLLKMVDEAPLARIKATLAAMVPEYQPDYRPQQSSFAQPIHAT